MHGERVYVMASIQHSGYLRRQEEMIDYLYIGYATKMTTVFQSACARCLRWVRAIAIPTGVKPMRQAARPSRSWRMGPPSRSGGRQ
jgi:hypothetical protein